MGDEFAAEEFGLGQGGVVADAVGLGPAEGRDVVGVGVELEDVGSVDFGVQAPDCVDAGRVAEVPEAGDEGVVLGGEFDDVGVVEHAEEFDAACTDEGVAEAGLVGAVGFTEEDEGLSACRLHVASSLEFAMTSVARVNSWASVKIKRLVLGHWGAITESHATSAS